MSELLSEQEANIEAAWRQEVAARLAALDAGEATTIPWSEVRDRLLAKLSAHWTTSRSDRPRRAGDA